MSEKKVPIEKQAENDIGSIKIADEVVKVIAGLAATETIGVAGMSGGIAAGVAELLGRKNLSKGVKVEVGEKETIIDLYIVVQFGVRIPDIALNTQQNVKRAVESMTGLKAKEINIHIQGVDFPHGESQEEEPRVK